MKILLKLSFLMLAVLTLAAPAIGQKKIKEGTVKFEMTTEGSESAELAMLGGSTLDFYFDGEKQRMDMNILGGMMKIQTFVPVKNPKDGAILMDMLGKKVQIVGYGEDDISNNYNFMNVDGIETVTYDENDKKEIAGYSCYKAVAKLDNGTTMKYYISEKIQPPTGMKKKDNKVMLKGYPLEMTIDTGQGFEMVFKATEVSKNLPEGAFNIPEGYEKMTMEEFQKQSGGLLGN